jgi:hypothetical protein
MVFIMLPFDDNQSLIDYVNSQPLVNPLVCLGDRHQGVWNLVQEFGTDKQRWEILDWYHLKENLCKVGGSPRGSNRLKLYNGHGNVEATKALFAGCRGKQVKTFVPISLSIAIELSTTNITKLSNYVQSVQVLWSQPSSSLANESKFPEHSGKLKMLIKSCLSVVLTSTVYWLSNVSAKMGCSQRILIIKPKYDLLSGLKDSFWNDYLFSDRDKEAVDFSVDDAGHK